MSTFTTSKGTRCQHVAPRTEIAAPRRLHPNTRMHIHGKIQPMNRSDRRWLLFTLAVVAPFIAGALSWLGSTK